MREAEPRGRDECCARQLRGPALSSLSRGLCAGRGLCAVSPAGLQNAHLEARNAP